VRKLLFAVILLVVFVPILSAQTPKPRAASTALIARGKYLVNNTSMCNDCHSAHNEKGEVIEGQRLKGASLDFKPAVPIPVWADKAVNLVGLPGWEKDAAIKFLMTGIAFNGLPARPPMPQYRFNERDAEAIVAYLQSLAPAK